MEEGHPMISATYVLTVNALASGSATGQAITDFPGGWITDSVSVAAPAMGGSTGLTVGDSGDTNRLFDVADTSSATDNQFSMVKAAAAAGQGYQYDTDTSILLYNRGGSNTTASDLTVYVTIVGRLDQSGSNYIDQ